MSTRSQHASSGSRNHLIDLPPLSAWDFDCCPRELFPPEEHEHCWFYEYGRESGTVVKLVRAWRRNRRRLMTKDDPIGNLIVDAWFGLPSRVLADYKEFPGKHWLEIELSRRKSYIEKLPPWSNLTCRSNSQHKYSGPQQSDIAELHAQQNRWREIDTEKGELLNACFEAETRIKTAEEYAENLKSTLLNRLKEKLARSIERRPRTNEYPPGVAHKLPESRRKLLEILSSLRT